MKYIIIISVFVYKVTKENQLNISLRLFFFYFRLFLFQYLVGIHLPISVPKHIVRLYSVVSNCIFVVTTVVTRQRDWIVRDFECEIERLA